MLYVFLLPGNNSSDSLFLAHVVWKGRRNAYQYAYEKRMLFIESWNHEVIEWLGFEEILKIILLQPPSPLDLNS